MFQPGVDIAICLSIAIEKYPVINFLMELLTLRNVYF